MTPPVEFMARFLSMSKSTVFPKADTPYSHAKILKAILAVVMVSVP
jgi:hypothetical protein